MHNPLKGLQVRVIGGDRVLRAAASWFADLGALVHVDAPLADPDEDLWLGRDTASPLPTADIVLVQGDIDPGLTDGVVARYHGSSSTAPTARARLDGRDLAAAGGVAIAVGEPDRAPLPIPEGCLEHMVGTQLAGAALAALLEGHSEVEVAGVDVIAWSVATNVNLYLPYGSAWRRAGRRANGSGGGYPYSVFNVKDGQFVLICRTTRDWQVLVEAMGGPDWTRGSRFRDRMAMGREYPDEVDERMAPWLLRQTRDDLKSLAARSGFPGGPVLRPEEVLALPSLEGTWRERGGLRAPGRPFEVAAVPGSGQGIPLRGLRVLDLSWVWSGPAVGVALADLGADVVKVESATRPDNTRLRGRPVGLEVSPHAPELELTPYFHAVNRGKRSISLDLKSEHGRQLLFELAAQADVIVENLSPGVMDRFGIPPGKVHEVNPGCIFLSMRGYRPHTTTTGLRAYAPVLSAAAGIEGLVGYPGEPPIGMMTYGLSDANAASQGLLLVLAALWHRRQSGAGAQLMLSQLDAAVVANGLNLVRAQTGRLRPLEPFAQDEPVVGYPDLPTSPWTSRDLFTTVSAPWLGDLAVSRLPWRLAGALPETRGPGPRLGAHTDEILEELIGMSAHHIERLRLDGVLA
jgi:crotonobetainyl-CoA:carnitine CoA-transferase CaiB-like acyl-CoA transferase